MPYAALNVRVKDWRERKPDCCAILATVVEVQEKIATLLKPVFVTSTKAETKGLSLLVRRVKRPYLWHYKPTVNGFHGSKTLWKSVNGSAL